MQKIFKYSLVFLSYWFVSTMVMASNSISQSDPKQMVLGLSNLVINTLNEQRTELESSNQKVLAFAEQNILPYVSTEKMARYALGKYWRSASADQKKNFTAAFTENLIRSYSQNFLKLQIDKVDVGDVMEDKPGRATIHSKVYQSDGKAVEVIYRAFKDKKDAKWYLYDVVIENVSMLLSYRSVYSSSVSKQGLDKVIAELEQKNREAIAQ